MSDLTTLNDLFFARRGLDPARAEALTGEALKGCDDGELFLEYALAESLTFDDGHLKNAAFNTSQGFGLRGVAGETTGYAHSCELSEAALTRAAQTVQSVRRGHGGTLADTSRAPARTNRHLYGEENPLDAQSGISFADKVKLLSDIDAYARARDPRVRQVMVSLAGSWQAVMVLRADGFKVGDIRPLVRLNVSVTVEENGRMEQGSFGSGGREGYAHWMEAQTWKKSVDEALRQGLVNLGAQNAPAGEMTVVLGPGWPGILLHEAVGHGLEGDFNRKKTSAFASLIGQRVAAPGVTVLDDGTLPGRRGSLTIDDEGTPTSSTILIEDGILKGFMQDRMNARLMGVAPTGNGRRQSFAHAPMPRMTNTYMLKGHHEKDEIIASVKDGLYAVNFGGGSVDITSGKFVFSASEAYRIENGRLGPAVKGATLIGNGPEALKKITMIGNDMALDPGIGTCGKDGQSVPVGVGQPTLKIEKLTVGGAED